MSIRNLITSAYRELFCRLILLKDLRVGRRAGWYMKHASSHSLSLIFLSSAKGEGLLELLLLPTDGALQWFVVTSSPGIGPSLATMAFARS